jgi:hypothetical protein
MNQRKLNSLPTRETVIEASAEPGKPIDLGERTVEYVIRNWNDFDYEWRKRLLRNLAQLRYCLQSNSPAEVIASEVLVELLHPVHRSMPDDEIEQSFGTTREAAVGWALGEDLSNTVALIGGSFLLTVLAVLLFGIWVYGVDSPGTKTVIVSSSLAWFCLAVAASLLGLGLFRHFVVPGSLSVEDTGGWEATVHRITYKPVTTFWIPWVSYTVGGLFLAGSATLSVIIGRETSISLMNDYTVLRIALLVSIAAGTIFIGYGAWPVVRAIITQMEVQRQAGHSRYAAPPQLLLTFLPLLSGPVFFLVNWLID